MLIEHVNNNSFLAYNFIFLSISSSSASTFMALFDIIPFISPK